MLAWHCILPGFTLRIAPHYNGRWLLSINGVPYGSYATPKQAAADAASQVTGDDNYDSSPISAPEDLEEWERR